MINFYGKTESLKSRKQKVKTVLKTISEDHQFKISNIDYIFVDDEELLQINVDSLQHDFYTDIITFDYSNNQILDGEIYISIDRVEENANTYGEKFHVELLRVIFHGVLHMVGYKDKTKLQQTEMRQKENFYINKYNELFHVEQRHEHGI